jgi:hypothetical protein
MGRHFGLNPDLIPAAVCSKKLDGSQRSRLTSAMIERHSISFMVAFLWLHSHGGYMLDKVCISAAAQLVVLISEMGS